MDSETREKRCSSERAPRSAGWVVHSQRARESAVWILSSDVVGDHEGGISYGSTGLIDATGALSAEVPFLTTGMLVGDFSPG